MYRDTRSPPIQKSRMTRLRANVEPLSTYVTVNTDAQSRRSSGNFRVC